MSKLTDITLAVDSQSRDRAFYERCFSLGDRLSLTDAHDESEGFRGFSVSLMMSQPGDVDVVLDAAIEADARVLKPAKASLFGYGGSVQAPDGTVWKVATAKKKDSGPVSTEINQVVLLLGVADVKSSKAFYVDRGFRVDKSFGGYVQFDLPDSPIQLALYRRTALAKDAGVSANGGGSHRVTLHGSVDPTVDPDGFVWT